MNKEKTPTVEEEFNSYLKKCIELELDSMYFEEVAGQLDVILRSDSIESKRFNLANSYQDVYTHILNDIFHGALPLMSIITVSDKDIEITVSDADELSIELKIEASETIKSQK